jgi:FSR family fosmidomycin resistance protein-like MFS transporter
LKTLKIVTYLSVYGITHALVDASCILLILGGIDVKDNLLTYILLYNILAFGLQMPLGLLIDKVRMPVVSAIIGCSILVIALMMFFHPLTAVILAGVGNALFHVGGGTISLNLKFGKASLPGVFVAPGGIGLFVGGMIASFYGFPYRIFVGLLLGMISIMLLLKSPGIVYQTKKRENPNYLVIVILLLLITVCIRSIVGLSVSYPWKSNVTLSILLILAISLGKGIGGFLADYFGWIKITVSGLMISAILFHWGTQFPILGLTGMFLFNMTMPVNLVAISNMLPDRPGFSFGLTTFAIVLGAIPTYFQSRNFLSGEAITLIFIIVSAISLFIGLNLHDKIKKNP